MADKIKFLKMDGVGNDFVIIDGRSVPVTLTAEQITKLADRDNSDTKGCDQLGVITDSANASCRLHIYNADGSQVDTCGNILRCVAQILMKELKKGVVAIETNSGIKTAALVGANMVKVDMGEPKFDWLDIPLTHLVDTMRVPISAGELNEPSVVNMGNPHAVFFVDSVRSVDLETVGPVLENDPIFPQRANIGVVNVVGDDLLHLRVWERGVGETEACGSGACAAVVAAHKRGLCDRHVTVVLSGGELVIDWLDNDRVMMTGTVNFQFEGSTTL